MAFYQTAEGTWGVDYYDEWRPLVKLERFAVPGGMSTGCRPVPSGIRR